MAVHLERPLPREPFPGKRHRRRVLALGALLTLGAFLSSRGARPGGLSERRHLRLHRWEIRRDGPDDDRVLQGDKVDPSEAAKALLSWAGLSEAQAAHAPSPISAPQCGLACRRLSALRRSSIAASPTAPQSLEPG